MKTYTTKQIVLGLFTLVIMPCFSQNETEKIWATFNSVPNIEITESGELLSTNSQLQNLISENNILSIEQALPASRRDHLQRVYEIECNCDAIDLIIDITESDVGISNPEIAPQYELLYDPNDYNAVFNPDYALDLIKAKGAWDYSKGDASTLIGISDANYHLGNVDLANKYLSFSYGNTNPNYAHGTAVALTAAGDTDNGDGKSSIGYNCMMHLRSMSYNNILDLSYSGCRVINCSWTSGCYFSQYYQDVIDEAYDNGSIVVCAAGNGGTCGGPTQLVYPAAFERTIAVSSIGPYDNHERTIGDPTTTHQHNASVDICAPGYDIATGITWTFGPSFVNGTSFASPYVSGTIGLILSLRPCLTYEEVLDILQFTAVDLDSINPNYAGLLGAGRLDAASALKYASLHEECPTFEVYSDPGNSGNSGNSNDPGVLVENGAGNSGNNNGNPYTDPHKVDGGIYVEGFQINKRGSIHPGEFVIDDMNINLFPNPTLGETNLVFDNIMNELITVKVTDMMGRVIYNNSVRNASNRLKLDLDKKGIFLVELEAGGVKIWQEKLVRQ